ncbi:MAG: M1 family metallopeptidase [Xanthomonadales bacterium]|jgi:aminopeptidase N|nr:M1 family metallopeptidase [Xanthomonadales bacterium]
MRHLLLVASIAVALTTVSLNTVAMPDQPAAAATPLEITTQLPRTVRPSHYAIEVTPHPDAMNFDGKVGIDIDVLEATDRIVLQAAQLKFVKAQLASEGQDAVALTVSLDAAHQTASFSSGKPLLPGKYVLSIEYSGKIGTQANGLFALDYPTEQGQRRALFTQFENSDARRFVPSWDEPNYKATFDLSVIAPRDQMVISNMPVATSVDDGQDLKRVSFKTSPKMSTYLLFLSMGDFERITLDDGGVEIGVIAQKGKVEQARYGLEASRDVLREYNDYFGVRYPLPKLDNIAAPGGSQFFSAMENWGAIFTFESSLLIDPALANTGSYQRVFGIGAHEIAHQWFGNLVTMAWWDDLWLNEGFASWLADRTTRKLHPEWDTNSVSAAFTSRAPMGGDAMSTTHPVVQHIATVEQASQAFDGITYGKGSAVISMLEDYVGENAWREGVRRYIKKHAFGNAVTEDLWIELEKAAPGKRFLDVAHDFTLKPGVPLIRAETQCVEGNTVLSLVQAEYSVDHPDKEPLHWFVPVTVQALGGEPIRTLVDGKASVNLPGCNAPVLVNAGQKGYFRTVYAPRDFKALTAHFDRLTVADQAGLIMDASAMATVKLQPESDALDLYMQLPMAAAPELWQMATRSLAGIDDLLKNDKPRQAAFRRFALTRLAPKFEELGWEKREGDSSSIQQLRTGIIRTVGSLGDERVLAEARRRFDAFLADPTTLSPELHRTVLGMVAYNADAAIWDRIHALAKQEKSSMLRNQYYRLLAFAKDEALAKRALDMAMTDEPGATLSASMISGTAWEHPDMTFDFAVAHREHIDTLVDSTSLAGYYPSLGAASDDIKMIDKIKAFAEQHIAATSRRDADEVVNGIRTRLKLREQRWPAIDAWLKKQGI